MNIVESLKNIRKQPQSVRVTAFYLIALIVIPATIVIFIVSFHRTIQSVSSNADLQSQQTLGEQAVASAKILAYDAWEGAGNIARVVGDWVRGLHMDERMRDLSRLFQGRPEVKTIGQPDGQTVPMPIASPVQ